MISCDRGLEESKNWHLKVGRRRLADQKRRDLVLVLCGVVGGGRKMAGES